MNSSFAITEKWRLLVEFAQCLIYCVQCNIFLLASNQRKEEINFFFTLSCWYSSNTFCEHQSDGQRFGTKFRLPSTLLLDSNHPSFVFFFEDDSYGHGPLDNLFIDYPQFFSRIRFSFRIQTKSELHVKKECKLDFEGLSS